jgi:antitoxin HicB
MEQFVYPAILTPDAKDGGFVVTFVDLPEAITQGETEDEALQEAADCLEEAMANRIVSGVPIPPPSRSKRGQYAVPVAAQTAAKAALYIRHSPYAEPCAGVRVRRAVNAERSALR